MIFHLIITPVVAFLNGLYALLPPWTMKLGLGGADGGGDGGSIDNSLLHYALAALVPFDKFVPLHDGVLPAVTIALFVFVGLNAFKLVKFGLSLIPTVSAGG